MPANERGTHLSTLISPQTAYSRSVAPISMKCLQICTCTTAAKYQHIYSKKSGLAVSTKANASAMEGARTVANGCSRVMSNDVAVSA